MALSLSEIHELEVTEAYPAAIDELENRIEEGYSDSETVIRLGFNLWYAVAEEFRLNRSLPLDTYRSRFVGLWRDFLPQMDGDADFCWSFGLGASLFAHEFDGISEADGNKLLRRAGQLDSFYEGDLDTAALSARFAGRGILESYYKTGAQQGGDLKPDHAAS